MDRKDSQATFLQGADGPKGEKGESASDSLQESLVRGLLRLRDPEPWDRKATWPDPTQASGGKGTREAQAASPTHGPTENPEATHWVLTRMCPPGNRREPHLFSTTR